MITRFKKNKKNHSYYKKIGIALGGVAILSICGFLVVADAKVYRKKQELNYQIKTLQNKVQEAKAKNEELKQGIKEADDVKYIEKVAREELDMQQPGEKVFSFIRPEVELKAAEDSSAFQSWLGWVGGWFK